MTIGRRGVLGLVLVVLVGAAGAAQAQSVEAETLFREGKRLMKEKKIGEACDKFEASDRLDPSVGTKLNLADCREKNGQLATAWAWFLKASAAAKASSDAKREAEAKRRAGALEPRLAYLTISVPDASRVEGLVIKRNGVVVDPALWNQGVPVDAGSYEISGAAPGHEAWSTKVEINAEAQKASVEVPRFKRIGEMAPAVTATTTHTGADKEPATTAPTGPVIAPHEEPPPEEPEQPAGRSAFTGMRKAAVGVAVLGAGGVVLGAVFGAKAKDLEKQADAICPSDACPSMDAVKLNSDARSKATIANVGFIGGGVALAGAVALWFLGAPKVADQPVAITPIVRGDQVGVSIGGSF